MKAGKLSVLAALAMFVASTAMVACGGDKGNGNAEGNSGNAANATGNSGSTSGGTGTTAASGKWDKGSTELSGAVEVDGSSTVYPITEAAAGEFKKLFPNVKVTVGVSGTGGGFKRFAIGETDVSDASRPIKDSEFNLAKENGVQFIELPVALDGLSIVLNPKNKFVDKLTVEDIQKIYLEGGASNWNEVNPSWPASKIKIYSPGSDSGTFDYFKEVMLPKGKSFRSDMTVSEDDHVLVNGVAGDEFAIGYFGASYYYENKDKLRAVPIVNPKTGHAVMPDPENVISGAYAPLSRPLFIYVSDKGAAKPQVRKFVEYFLDHSDKFAKQVKYVDLPKDVREMAIDRFTKRVYGTFYWDKDMKKREGNLASYKSGSPVNTK